MNQVMNTQRNDSGSQNSFVMALERLSSALRTYKTKDEIKQESVIAPSFTKQLTEVDQAVRNANDGVSLTQIAESALSKIQNNLQRARTFAVQSITANSVSARAALGHEIQQCMADIDRIASHTHFNGLPLLNGTFGTSTFQVGVTASETIAVNVTTGVRTNQMGQIATSTGSAVTAKALSVGDVTIAVGAGQAVSIGASIAGAGASQTADSAYAKAQAINRALIPTLTATASTIVAGPFITTSAIAGDTYGLMLNGVTIFHHYDLSTQGALTSGLVAIQINVFSNQTGVSATFDNDTNQLTLIAPDGRNIRVEQILGGAATGGFTEEVVGQIPGGITHRGTISLSAGETIVLEGNYFDLGFRESFITKDAKTLIDMHVTTAATAKEAINRIDASLATVSHLRSALDAVRSRFQSTIVNLQAVSQNLSFSRGRLPDPEFALETATLIRSQILRHTHISLLTQANSTPQAVLKLLS